MAACGWLALWIGASRIFAQSAAPLPMATDPAYHQLDFWVGDWEVSESDSHDRAGRAHIEKLLKGAAVAMVWTNPDGSEIREWFYYYRPEKRWRQLYVADSGFVKTREQIESLADGSRRFVGKVPLRGGSGDYLDRSTVTPLPDGRVHQLLERSRDGGATWSVSFDCVYAPAKRM